MSEESHDAAKLAAADQEHAAAKARPSRNTAAPAPEIHPPAPCEGCRQHQEATDAHLAQLDERVTSVAKIVVTSIIAGAVIYFLHGLDERPARGAAAITEG